MQQCLISKRNLMVSAARRQQVQRVLGRGREPTLLEVKEMMLFGLLKQESSLVEQGLAQLKGMLASCLAECFQQHLPCVLLELARCETCTPQAVLLVLECLVSLTYSDLFSLELASSLNIYDFLLAEIGDHSSQVTLLAVWVVSNLCGNGLELDPDDLIRKHFIVRGIFSQMRALVSNPISSNLADAILWLLTNLLRQPTLQLDHSAQTLQECTGLAAFAARVLHACHGRAELEGHVERAFFVLTALYSMYPIDPLTVPLDTLLLYQEDRFRGMMLQLMLQLLRSPTRLFLLEHQLRIANETGLFLVRGEQEGRLLDAIRESLVAGLSD